MCVDQCLDVNKLNLKIKWLCLFRRLGLNFLIHMDYFYLKYLVVFRRTYGLGMTWVSKRGHVLYELSLYISWRRPDMQNPHLQCLNVNLVFVHNKLNMSSTLSKVYFWQTRRALFWMGDWIWRFTEAEHKRNRVNQLPDWNRLSGEENSNETSYVIH